MNHLPEYIGIWYLVSLDMEIQYYSNEVPGVINGSRGPILYKDVIIAKS